MNKAQGGMSRRSISKVKKKGRDVQAQKGVEGKRIKDDGECTGAE